MARLPDANSLTRERAPTNTPGIRVGTIDYGPSAAAAKALGQGLEGLAVGVRASVTAQDEIDDYETKKKLLDFKLQTEMAQEEYRREMPPGGTGFAATWDQTYKKQADSFFGKGGANISASQRAKVDLALTQHQVALSERAQRAEMAERDRAEIDGLETTLGTTKSRVEASPERLEEIRKEGQGLIELSRIPPADRHRLARKYDKELDKTAALTRLMNLKTADDFKAFETDVAPHVSEPQAKSGSGRDLTGVLTSGKARAPAAGWVAGDARWQRLDPFQRAAAMALMEADGANPDDARNALGAMINRAAKGGEDLGAHVSQKIYQPTIEPAQQARLGKLLASDKFEMLTDWARRRAAGQEADPVNGATHFLAHEPVMERLRAQEPGKYKSWVGWTGYDKNGGKYGNPDGSEVVRDKSHAFLAPEGRYREGGPSTLDRLRIAQGGPTQADKAIATPPAGIGDDPEGAQLARTASLDGGVPESVYAGPYKHLSITERKTLWQQAQSQQKKMTDGLMNEIKEFSGNAALGKLPPDEVLADLESRVAATGDPRVRASYESTLGLADITRRLQNAPPQAVERFARDIEARMGDTAMPEEQKRLEHVKKLAESMRKATNEDAMTWAHQRRVMVPVGEPGSEGAAYQEPVQLERIDFQAPDVDVTLKRRQLQAQRVGEFYGQPPQFFTKIERDALSDKLRVGGAPMLDILGKMYKAFGNDMPLAMKEISKNAPEVAILGKLMAEGGDPRLLEDAAKGLKLRTDMGDKFISHVDRKLVEPDVAALTAVLGKTPGMSDPVIRATNAIYEYRHRRDGKDKFDDALYKQTMAEVLGETKDAAGVKYGGVGKQGAGWTDGKWSSGVLVPPGVRQDSFDDMIALVQDKDLIGFSRPLHGDGKPLSALEVRRSTWVSVGTGRYVLQTGSESGGAPNYAVDPVNPKQPFVLDVRPLLGEFRKRNPDIFAK